MPENEQQPDEPEPRPLGLFEGVGVELEYMIVDEATHDVRPLCDRLMEAAAGSPESEIERAHGVSWSNELVNHVVELKTTHPTRDLRHAAACFELSVREANELLRPLGACLVGTGMHPWMDPRTETTLWAHEYSSVYQHFDRLFDCRRHGWANLQSMHLNLPFRGDAEFARLHAAVRLVLPLLPALCASSPIMDARATGLLDNRLKVYASNQEQTPSLTGLVIPEPVYSEDEYREKILTPIARDVACLDPTGVMKPEWMNSRGAIARFDRGSIEIRVMDVQEHPRRDLAIAEGVVSVLRGLCDEHGSTQHAQQAVGVAALRRVFDACVRDAERAAIDDEEYLRALGLEGEHTLSAQDAWRRLLGSALPGFVGDPSFALLRAVVERGPIARTMLAMYESAGEDAQARSFALRRMLRVLGELLAGTAVRGVRGVPVVRGGDQA